MIIIGYQGIGKSTLAGKMRCIDLESTNFYLDGQRQDDWYRIYGNIALDISGQGYTVLSPTHAVLRQYLHDRNSSGEAIYVCHPSLSLKNEWITRLRDRYGSVPSDKNFRALHNAIERYDDNIREIMDDAAKFGWGTLLISSMDYSLEEMVRNLTRDQK